VQCMRDSDCPGYGSTGNYGLTTYCQTDLNLCATIQTPDSATTSFVSSLLVLFLAFWNLI
jgi:hypothetical protein